MDNSSFHFGFQMVNLLKKHDFLPPWERHYTRDGVSAFDLINFRESDSGDEDTASFECPAGWSNEAASLLADEAAILAPENTKSIEENTVPSWLWRRVAEGSDTAKETGAQQIFRRIAGTAAYAGWKKDVFVDERDARIFFDEVCYLLAQRFIAIEPRYLATVGLDWAYGIEPRTSETFSRSSPVFFETADFIGKENIDIRNASIDAVLGGDASIRKRWQKFLAAGTKSGALTLRFADIAADWNPSPAPMPGVTIDLLAFRREDGAVDLERLRHVVRLLVTLLDLQSDTSSVAIGFHNLAPLLLSQALAYDSDAGRATAAAIAAIVTAEAYATSARLAGLLGPSLDFAANRQGILRSLRNRRRAAWGDRNDYEKVSVLPAPLMLDPAADLGLIAAARRGWDEALELVQRHGLRCTQTDLSLSPSLILFTESTAQGIAPMRMLTVARAEEGEAFTREVHPAALEALIKLGLNADQRRSVIAHISGSKTLNNAPGINHTSLRRHGFDKQTLEKIENYLPYVNDIRLAFTPWIIGEDFYRDTLKIPAAKSRNSRFDLLHYLSFSDTAIKSANKFCYGHNSAVNAKGLTAAQSAIFSPAQEISTEAQIRMAASVQSFVSGNVGLQLVLATDAPLEKTERLMLGVWRQGIKSVTVEFTLAEKSMRGLRLSSRLAIAKPASPASASSPLSSYSGSLRSTMHGKPKAQGKMVSLRKASTHKHTRTEK